jgi:hypothetical protein
MRSSVWQMRMVKKDNVTEDSLDEQGVSCSSFKKIKRFGGPLEAVCNVWGDRDFFSNVAEADKIMKKVTQPGGLYSLILKKKAKDYCYRKDVLREVDWAWDFQYKSDRECDLMMYNYNGSKKTCFKKCEKGAQNPFWKGWFSPYCQMQCSKPLSYACSNMCTKNRNACAATVAKKVSASLNLLGQATTWLGGAGNVAIALSKLTAFVGWCF